MDQHSCTHVRCCHTKSRFCTDPLFLFCSILTPAQRKACTETVHLEGFEAVDNALACVKSEEATATVEADLKAIQALITQSHGGYTALNEAVKVRLRSWFQDITGTIEAIFSLGTFEGCCD